MGSGSPIRIRGVGSLTLGSNPIIFVDGVRARSGTELGPELGITAASALDDINPNDIESIEIIKGPAAATLYGTEASAGVIQIITKRGAAGAPVFDFSVTQGFRALLDPEEKIGTFWGCRSTGTPPCPLEDIFTYNPVTEANWYVQQIRETGTSGLYPGGATEWNSWACDELFCKGHMQTYNLGIRGGTDQLRYYVSGEFLGDTGIQPWNTNDRVTVRANLNTLLAENLTLDISTGYADGYTRFGQVSGEGDVWEDMQWGNGYCLARVNPGLPQCARLGGFQERLPSDIESVENTREWTRFIGSMTAQHTYNEWLTQRLVFGVDKAWDTNRNFFPLDPVSPPYRVAQQGQIRYERPLEENRTLDYGISARTQLNESFTLTTSAGVQYYQRIQENFRNTGYGFALPVQETINQTDVARVELFYSFEENKSLGAYIQEEINWNSRAFLTLAVRADDNSAFGANFDAQYYPKVSATWVVSEESFWDDVPLVNTLRLRSALGQAGRQPGTFDGRTIWQSYTGRAGLGAVRPAAPGNADIGPEVSTELEVGFDVALLDDRISGEFTYFTKQTRDALLNQSLAPSLGIPGNYRTNLGRIDNWGWEANLNANVLTRDNVSLDLTLSGDHVDNEIKDLGDFIGTNEIQLGFPFPNVTNTYNIVSYSDELNQFGLPVEVLCDGGTGVSGRELGGEVVPCQTMQGKPLLVGNNFYTYTWTVAPTLTLFNSFRLFAVAQGMYGKTGTENQVGWGMRYNNSYCGQALQLDPACLEWRVKNTDGMFADRTVQWLFDSDFWKLREVGASYDLPQSITQRAGADRASISVSARELGTLWRAQDHLGGTAAGAPGRYFNDSEAGELRRLPGITTLAATLRVTF